MKQTLKSTSLISKGTESGKILIVSSIIEDWGGSEELWARCIPLLQSRGFQIAVLKNKINYNHSKFIDLDQIGVSLHEITPKLAQTNPLLHKVNKLYTKIARKLFRDDEFVWPFTQKLLKINPDMVIISQGINFDGLGMAYQCLKHNIPYVVVAQKAVDFYWPEFFNRPHMIQALQTALKCFFVSHHNHRLTEEQFGLRLNNALVIHNPVKISNGIIPYPVADGKFRLACIGRLFILDKGQDILLRILAQDKWKERPITVSFIGTGGDAEGLQAMAKLLDVKNVEFIGHVDDIENLWRNYHALLLPSRSEGLPLAMIEAMAAGRTVIVSNAGGNAEVISDGVNGYIGIANEASFEEAMERAWVNRAEWQNIGLRASEYVAENIPKSPETEFAGHILDIFGEINKNKKK